MGVTIEFITIIVRKDAIALKYPGGLPAFEYDFCGGPYRADSHLAAFGHMGAQDVEASLSVLESLGMELVSDGLWKDVAVVNQFFGPSRPCPWLEFEGDAAHLAGAPREPIRHYTDARPPEDPSLADRRRGVLLGLAAGDKIGGPRAMALELAYSLNEFDGLYNTDLKRRYLSWWRAGGDDTGRVFDAVMMKVNAGMPWDDAVASVDQELGGMTGGCNPAHRAAPLAMAGISTGVLVSEAHREASFTHKSEIAGSVSAFVVVLCRLLLVGSTWQSALKGAGFWTKAPGMAVLPRSAEALKPDGFAPNTLQAALYFIDQNSSFGAAMDDAVDFAGGANYCPVLVGSIGGARWGASAIPARHLEHAGDLSPFWAAAKGDWGPKTG
ncbi:putative ribosylglycohydrolase (putative secreted protein) [Paramagnetospirillum magnetotacticum MS-1]|uniref:Putative ribosylglycohydrolase (Putative secreted protein) n=1 Tax=Paramagnetospirillum magnetotacticum MS-1 TaxID=272627 RepID=A0A0C2U603_PARME|nr:ADP-ribosylglycohydrolase family protein [Paramagnetospirillum magnetotacticum]KIL96882.1 putative ribosylglycohydrolase (putative secreted protein) [Paramagnetospirillum magnetotacticum MS-1]